MAVKRKAAAKKRSAAARTGLERALELLERQGTKATRDGMARYGIVAPKAFGVTMGALRQIAKRIGVDHELALELWDTGWYEARMLATLIDDPEQLTSAQMDRWLRDFDNWAIVDTACFALFDRSPLAWRKLAPWSKEKGEFQKRAAFALLACLALHGRGDDAKLLKALPLIERGASDERNFVKKGVSWALRGVGQRNLALNAAAIAVAKRLAASSEASAKWIGKDALRELTGPTVAKRLAKRAQAA